MPAMHFTIRWPDGSEERCYSPSTVLLEYFSTGQSYSVTEFIAQAEKALMAASDRVAARYGYACSSAADQLMALKQIAPKYPLDGQVDILAIE